MIVGVNRMGGLGNQFFQYAAARAVALRHGISRIIMDQEVANEHNHHQRNYAGTVFDGEEDPELFRSITTTFDQGEFADPWNVDMIKPPVCLSGYFQYLPPILPVIPHLRAMIRKNLFQQRHLVRDRFAPFDGQRSVFLHVRRGDYLSKSYYHFVQSLNYYREAHRRLSRNEEKTIYIISDDETWVRQQDWGFAYILVEEKDELIVFALMSLCRGGAIIANSTFSWWGAMMADSEQVFYPRRWINAPIHCLFPDHWIPIDP